MQTPKQEPSCLSAGRLLRKNNSLHIALEAVLRQKLDGLLRRGVHVEGTADGARLRAAVRRFKGAVIGGAEALVVVQLRAEVRVRLDEQTVAGADYPGDGDARIIALERGEEDGVTGGRARGRGSPDTGRGWGRK